MSQHAVAYYKSILSVGTLQQLTPVPDPTVTIDGNDLNVPATYNQLVKALHLPGNANASRAQLQSPSLRALFFPDLSPYAAANNDDFPGLAVNLSDNPIQLVTNEGLEFWSDGGGNGTSAANVYGLAFLSDGALVKSGGKMFTVRATTAIQAALAAYAAGALTFDQTLPVGTYDILGMRVEALGCVLGRLIFIGSSAITRPGVPGCSAAGVAGDTLFRYGNSGILGTFISTNPPSLEILGGTTTAQVVYLDLIKRA